MHQLVFYLPIAFGALLAVGAAVGLLEGGLLEGGDADLDLDLDAEADVDADAEGDGDAEGETSGLAALLTLLGVGRAPLGILVMSACFLFGIIGLTVDLALEAALGSSAGWVLLSAALALVITALSTGVVGRALGRLVPSEETYASQKSDLLGRTGVAQLATDARYGRARVVDGGGAQLEVRCRTIDDEPIARGEALVVADYDEETDTFLVARLPS